MLNFFAIGIDKKLTNLDGWCVRGRKVEKCQVLPSTPGVTLEASICDTGLENSMYGAPSARETEDGLTG